MDQCKKDRALDNNRALNEEELNAVAGGNSLSKSGKIILRGDRYHCGHPGCNFSDMHAVVVRRHQIIEKH